MPRPDVFASLDALTGIEGDEARQSYEDAPQAYETPSDTERRVGSQNQAKRLFGRIKAEDLSQRGIAYDVAPNGMPREVTDQSGAPLTNTDKAHKIAYDSTGKPVDYSQRDTSGNPIVKDAYEGIPDWTDPKTGDTYKRRKELPWQWTGEDTAVKGQIQQKETDKLNRETATALAGPEQELKTRATAAAKALKASQKATQIALANEGVTVDLANADDRTVRAAVDSAYATELNSRQANDKPWFGGGKLSPAAEAYRRDIDSRKAATLDLVRQHQQAAKTAADVQSQYQTLAQQRSELRGDRLADINEKRVAAGLQPVGLPSQTVSAGLSSAGPSLDQLPQDSQPAPQIRSALPEQQVDQSASSPQPAVTPSAPQAEGMIATAGRELTTHFFPAAGTALGAAAGRGLGALAGIETGPGAIVTGLLGGLAGAAGGGALVDKIQRSIMGQEWTDQNEKQLEANRKEHPVAAMLGSMAPFLISMIGGGEAIKPLQKAMGPFATRIAEGAASFAQQGLSEGVQQQFVEGKDVNALDSMTRSVIAGGAVGLFPPAKSLLMMALGKAVPDIVAMTLANSAYDAAVHQKPIDLTDVTHQIEGGYTAFALQNLILGLMHRMPLLPPGKGGARPPEVQPPSEPPPIPGSPQGGDPAPVAPEATPTPSEVASPTESAKVLPPAANVGESPTDLQTERDQLAQSVQREPTSQVDAALIEGEKRRLAEIDQQLTEGQQAEPQAQPVVEQPVAEPQGEVQHPNPPQSEGASPGSPEATSEIQPVEESTPVRPGEGSTELPATTVAQEPEGKASSPEAEPVASAEQVSSVTPPAKVEAQKAPEPIAAKKGKPAEATPVAGQQAGDAKISKYDEAQERVDAIMDRLESNGVNVIHLYNPNDAGVEALAGHEDWKPMPPDLVKAYADRDAIGAAEFEQSRTEMTKALERQGLNARETERVLDYYGIRSDKTDASAQYLASQHAVEIAKQDPLKQAESISYALAAERGETFDELRDVSQETRREAALAVISVRRYLGLEQAQTREAKLSAPRDVLNTAKSVKLTTPKGANFIRVTDAKGRQIVEPIENVTKGSNVFHGAGPFKKVEAGVIGKKGFVPLKGELTAADANKPAVSKEAKLASTQFNITGADAAPIRSLIDSIPEADLYTDTRADGTIGKGREAEPHVTAFYGLKSNDPADVMNAVRGSKPVTIKLGKVSVFSNPDKPYDVLKVDVSGPDLHALNAKLRKLPNSNEYPDYKPHITLAYVKKGSGDKYVGDTSLKGKTITLPVLTHSTSERVHTPIPLSATDNNQQKSPNETQAIPADERRGPATEGPGEGRNEQPGDGRVENGKAADYAQRAQEGGAQEPDATEADAQGVQVPLTPEAQKVEKLARAAFKLHAPEIEALGHGDLTVGETPNKSGIYTSEDGKIIIDPEKMARDTDGLTGAQKLKKIKRSMAEEVFHVGTIRYAQESKENFAKVEALAKDAEWAKRGAEVYGKEWEKLNDFQKGAEIARIIAQGKGGKLTEAAYKYLVDFLKWLRVKVKDLSPETKEVISEIEKRMGIYREESKASQPKEAPKPEIKTPELMTPEELGEFKKNEAVKRAEELLKDAATGNEAAIDLLKSNKGLAAASTPEDARKSVLDAYKKLKERDGFPAVKISDLQKESGVPMEALRDWLKNERNLGTVVLSTGDWSIAGPEERAAVVKMHGQDYLQARFIGEPKAPLMAEVKAEKQFDPPGVLRVKWALDDGAHRSGIVISENKVFMKVRDDDGREYNVRPNRVVVDRSRRQPAASKEVTTPSVKPAYDKLSKESGFQAVPISELQKSSGADMDSLKAFLRKERDAGRVVLSTGDWSIADEAERKGVIDMHGQKYLQVRWLPEKRGLGAASSEREEPFYSQLTRAVEKMPQETMTVGQARAQISKNAKPDEIKASGILDDPFSPLAGKGNTDKVTKKELADFAIEKQTKVHDVTLGGITHSKPLEWTENGGRWTSRDGDGKAGNSIDRIKGNGKYRLSDDTGQRAYDTLEEAQEKAEQLHQNSNPPREATSFSQYQLPGAEPGSYREQFVTWPKRELQSTDLPDGFELKPSEFGKDTWDVFKDGKKINGSISGKDRAAAWARGQKVLPQPIKEWNDGHAAYEDIQNPVVRIRRNIRTDSEGRKTFFIEELQGPQKPEQEKMPEAVRKRIFEIGMKRAMREAADEGVDRIGWTDGQTQADRYDLSKHVDELLYTKKPDGKFDVSMRAKGESILREVGSGVAPEQLEGIVGKEAAQKIESGEGMSNPEQYGPEMILKGDNLKIGGFGLKRLYDVTLPRIAKKLTGGNVETSSIDGGRPDDATVAKQNKITPEEFYDLPNDVQEGMRKDAKSESTSIHSVELPSEWKQKSPSFALYAASTGAANPATPPGKRKVPGLDIARDVTHGVQSLLLPSAQSPEHLKAAETLGSKLGPMNQRQESARELFKKDFWKFEKLGVHKEGLPIDQNPGVQFMSDMSTGRKMEPDMEAIAKKMDAQDTARLALLEKADAPLQTIREDYFPGLWTNESRQAFNLAMDDALKEGMIAEGTSVNDATPQEKAWVKARVDEYLKNGQGSDKDALGYLTKTPLKGKESFRKQKVFDKDIATAFEFGLRPVSYNPVDAKMLKWAEMDRNIMANQALQEWKANGQMKVIRLSDKIPEGWQKVNDKYGTVYGPQEIEVTAKNSRLIDKETGENISLEEAGLDQIPPEGTTLKVKAPGLVITGQRIVPNAVGDILNNYLSSSLYNNRYFGKIYTGWMGFANALNQTQLGVGSAFHAGFTTMEAQISAGANLIKDVFGVMRGNRHFGHMMGSVKKLGTASVETAMTGDKVLNAWRNPDGTIDPKIARVVRAAELAGGGFTMERGLQTDQRTKAVSDWFNGHRLRAAARSPVAAIELMAHPIMNWLVPRQKAGVFAHMADRIYEQNPDKTAEELAPQFRAAWNRVDARLGQVRYDRLFINNTAKNVIQGAVRAPGWSGGTIAELGGAFKDTYSFFREWQKTGKIPKDIPDRVAYTASLLITVGLTNAVLTYALTGEQPKDLDYWAFRTGGKDEQGNPERFVLPTYMKDLLAYSKEPLTTLVNKAHPALSLIGDLVRNKDYYGVTIRNEDDNALKKAYDSGKYVAKAFEPFWMRGARREADRGTSLTKQALPMIGVMPAPKKMVQSTAERLADQYVKDTIPIGGRTQAQADASQAKYRLVEQIRRHQPPDIRGEIKAGHISPQDVPQLVARANMTPLQFQVKKLPLDRAEAVYRVASPEEKRQLLPIMASKRQNSRQINVPQRPSKDGSRMFKFNSN